MVVGLHLKNLMHFLDYMEFSQKNQIITPQKKMEF